MPRSISRQATVSLVAVLAWISGRLAIASPVGVIGEYFSIAAAFLVIALLWTGRANAFFRG